jgi:hypothetical protein
MRPAIGFDVKPDAAGPIVVASQELGHGLLLPPRREADHENRRFGRSPSSPVGSSLRLPVQRRRPLRPWQTFGCRRRLASSRRTMTQKDLPDAIDRNAVAAFARSFDGYQHHGSFQAAADAASSERRNSLDDLRNELFIAYRGSNHRGDDIFLETYRELLPLFRDKLGQS